MTSKPSGILAIWHDIAKESREDTLRWYDQEHHAERMSVPGFRSARRYAACGNTPELFIRYETESVSVLSSPEYLARVNAPTEWSDRAQRTIRNNTRSVFSLARRHGRASGGHVLTIRLPNTDAPPLDALWPELRKLVTEEDLLAAELWQAEHAHTDIPSREKELRGTSDGRASGAIVLHSSRRSALERIRAQDDRIKEICGAVEVGLYQLCFELNASKFHIEG